MPSSERRTRPSLILVQGSGGEAMFGRAEKADRKAAENALIISRHERECSERYASLDKRMNEMMATISSSSAHAEASRVRMHERMDNLSREIGNTRIWVLTGCLIALLFGAGQLLYALGSVLGVKVHL